MIAGPLVISSHVARTFDDLKVMLVDGAAVVQAAMRSVGAFLEWLDSEVYIIGFSKLYEGATLRSTCGVAC